MEVQVQRQKGDSFSGRPKGQRLEWQEGSECSVKVRLERLGCRRTTQVAKAKLATGHGEL
jgi:hypothetical protein